MEAFLRLFHLFFVINIFTGKGWFLLAVKLD
jgi:hypothetical protein